MGDFLTAILLTRHSLRIRLSHNPSQFFDAVLAGNAQAVSEHLATGTDPDIVRPEDGATPLHVAASAGHVHVIEVLLDIGADPNAQNNDGCTALDLAIAQGHTASADALRKATFL